MLRYNVCDDQPCKFSCSSRLILFLQICCYFLSTLGRAEEKEPCDSCDSLSCPTEILILDSDLKTPFT